MEHSLTVPRCAVCAQRLAAHVRMREKQRGLHSPSDTRVCIDRSRHVLSITPALPCFALSKLGNHRSIPRTPHLIVCWKRCCCFATAAVCATINTIILVGGCMPRFRACRRPLTMPIAHCLIHSANYCTALRGRTVYCSRFGGHTHGASIDHAHTRNIYVPGAAVSACRRTCISQLPFYGCVQVH